MSDFSIQLSMENVILGLSVSIIIGIVSGIVPALSAARLDPVRQLEGNYICFLTERFYFDNSYVLLNYEFLC